MIKLRAPDGISSIVHDGAEVPIGDDRTVEVDDHSAEVFQVHGFRPWNRGKDAVVPAEGLQANSPAAAPGTVIPPDDTETGGEHEQDISGLNRRALFAFLRAKGVPVSLPVTNEELRAAARRAREG